MKVVFHRPLYFHTFILSHLYTFILSHSHTVLRQALLLTLCRLAGLALGIVRAGGEILNHLDQRHEHGDDNKAYAYAEEDDEHRLDGCRKALERGIDLLLVKVGDLREHL